MNSLNHLLVDRSGLYFNCIIPSLTQGDRLGFSQCGKPKMVWTSFVVLNFLSRFPTKSPLNQRHISGHGFRRVKPIIKKQEKGGTPICNIFQRTLQMILGPNAQEEINFVEGEASTHKTSLSNIMVLVEWEKWIMDTRHAKRYFNQYVQRNPLEPTTHCHLSKKIPHQLIYHTRALPQEDSSFFSSSYGVLAIVSSCCSAPKHDLYW